jgi:transposase
LKIDGGYTGQPFADKIREILNCSVEVVKRFDEHMFKVIPKRWVVERCFARLKKYRRLFKNVERKIPTSKDGSTSVFGNSYEKMRQVNRF